MAVEKDDGDAAVMDGVFSSDRDRGADFAAPEPETKAEAPPPPEAPPEPKAEAEDEAKRSDPFTKYRDSETGRLVPLNELKSEREKRQEAQRMRDEAAREAAYWRGQAEAVQRAQQQPRQEQPQQRAPDPFTEPEAYQEYVVQQAQLIAQSERLNTSQMLAEEKYGEQKVADASELARRAGLFGPNSPFLKQRNPYGALMQWFDRQVALQEIGNPSEYKEKLKASMREEILAELKGTKPAAPAAQQRFPGTLADATGSGPPGPMAQSDESMMGEIFGTSRRSARR